MLTPDQVHDFVTNTLSEFKRNRWTDISLEFQDYIASSLITEKAVQEQGGPDISFRLKTRNTGTARNTGLFAQDYAKAVDLTIPASVGWTKQTVNWIYDVDEDLFQRGKNEIISVLAAREHAAMSDMAELNEENLWGAPSSSDDKAPMGIPFWLQKDPTTTPEGGFNGGNPAGFAAGAANVDSTKHKRWRNWTAGYTQVSTKDLVKKIKRSLRKCHFKNPAKHPELGYGNAPMWCMYSVLEVLEELEALAESRNDNLGKDVARYMNEVVVGGVPVKWVPILDDDTTEPIYGVNWQVFRPFVKTGCNMRRSQPMPAPGNTQHTVKAIHYDTWMNYICYNRRATFVISK